MHIYHSNTAVPIEKSIQPIEVPSKAAISKEGQSDLIREDMAPETSLAHFCAFVDFYTRQCNDPLSTSLTCEKQAEAVEILPQDLHPETIRMLLDTMLEAIDHLEKKWLDEQIQHDDRKRRHREDVARLYQQIKLLQPEPKPTPFYEKGIQRFANWLLWRKEPRQTPSQSKGSGKPRKGILRQHKSEVLQATVNA